MPRPLKHYTSRSEEQKEHDKSGNRKLFLYMRSEIGGQKKLAQATGLAAPALSRMGNGSPISAETAMLIEVGTEGALKAAELCPSRADLFAKFRKLA